MRCLPWSNWVGAWLGVGTPAPPQPLGVAAEVPLWCDKCFSSVLPSHPKPACVLPSVCQWNNWSQGGVSEELEDRFGSSRWLGQTCSSCQLYYFRGCDNKHWDQKKYDFLKLKIIIIILHFRKQRVLRWEELPYPIILVGAPGTRSQGERGQRGAHQPVPLSGVTDAALAVVCSCVCANTACRLGTECPVQMPNSFLKLTYFFISKIEI